MGSSSSDADSAGQSIGDALSQAVERLLKAAAAVDPQRPGTLNKNSEELSSAVERLLDAATPIDPQPLPALNKRIKALKARIEQLKNG